jgi:hypothetical protein
MGHRLIRGVLKVINDIACNGQCDSEMCAKMLATRFLFKFDKYVTLNKIKK